MASITPEVAAAGLRTDLKSPEHEPNPPLREVGFFVFGTEEEHAP